MRLQPGPDLESDECVDPEIESFFKEIEASENLPQECKRIDPEREIEVQKWILRMTLEAL